MNIQYNKQKRDVNNDPLVDALLRAKEFVTAHAQSLVVFGIVVVVVVVGVLTYQGMKARSIRKAQESFGSAMMAYASGDNQKAIDALSLVQSNHANTPQASYSALLMGNLLLNQGKYEEAIKHFEFARARGSGTFVAGSALEGLAACYEAKGDNARAISLLEQALADSKVGFRRSSLRWKIALISKNTQLFDKALRYCRDIVSDTSASDYRTRAENLLVELEALKGS